MELEDQIVSLELAKRIKELGVKQDSYFWWVNPDMTEGNVTQLLSYDERYLDHHPDLYYSAFTASELMDMLPAYIEPCGYFTIIKMDRSYEVSYSNIQENCPTSENISNSLAKMIIQLLEQKLI